MLAKLPGITRQPRQSNRQRKTGKRKKAVYVLSAAAGVLVFGGVSQTPAPQDLAHAVAGGRPAPARPVPTPSASASHAKSGKRTQSGILTSDAIAGVPATVLQAYKKAASAMAKQEPGCHLTWPLLAGIGKVESNNAEDGDVSSSGELLHPILGPVLDGSDKFAAIPNDFGSEWGQSGAWARAVGSMQFLPSTWVRWGVSGHTLTDPNNVFDASLAAARYLCSGGGDLSTPTGLFDAIYSYNQSNNYVAEVVEWMRIYQSSGTSVPNDPAAWYDFPTFTPPSSSGQASTVSSKSSGKSSKGSGNGSGSSPTTASSPSASGGATPTPTPSKSTAPVVNAVNNILKSLLP